MSYMKRALERRQNPRTHGGKTLYLYALNRGYYVVHPDGNIERIDMYLPPAGDWKMIGVLCRRGPLIGQIRLLEDISPEWWADQEPRDFTVYDLDHGTERSWENTSLISIAFYDRPEATPYYQYSREWTRDHPGGSLRPR